MPAIYQNTTAVPAAVYAIKLSDVTRISNLNPTPSEANISRPYVIVERFFFFYINIYYIYRRSLIRVISGNSLILQLQ